MEKLLEKMLNANSIYFESINGKTKLIIDGKEIKTDSVEEKEAFEEWIKQVPDDIFVKAFEELSKDMDVSNVYKERPLLVIDGMTEIINDLVKDKVKEIEKRREEIVESLNVLSNQIEEREQSLIALNQKYDSLIAELSSKEKEIRELESL